MVCLRGPIQGLLLCTKPVRWRKPLGMFLRDYALDEPLKEGLQFLSTMVSVVTVRPNVHIVYLLIAKNAFQERCMICKLADLHVLVKVNILS